MTLTYALDSLERPIGLTDNTNYTWAGSIQYNPASQITNAAFPSGTETWIYNTLQQLSQRITTAGSAYLMNMTYNYTAGANNGQIGSSIDTVTAETVTYQYDSLKRLANASSSAWSDTYTYDGFGNLTGMTGSGGPPLSVSVNPATNQIWPTNIAYDGNGNVTQFAPSGSLITLGYDVANRVATVNSTNAYAYDSSNQRAYFRNSAGTETLYVYGMGGKKLATYTIAGITGNQVNFAFQSRNLYFGGKLISAEGNAVAVDRLGSVRWSAAGSVHFHTYYPYGAEYNTTASDTEKYATYTRDNLTTLDYAMNRYYSSNWGRFMAPDPSYASMDLRTPQSWNRYMYALGDPIAGNDPKGLDDAADGGDGATCPDGEMCFFGGGGGGGGDGGPVGYITSLGNFSASDPVVTALANGMAGGATPTEQGFPVYSTTGVAFNDQGGLSGFANATLYYAFQGSEAASQPETYAAITMSGIVGSLGMLDVGAASLITGTSPDAPSAITTLYGTEYQSSTGAAQSAAADVLGGANLYKAGALGASETNQSQYWSLENPLATPNYAYWYGVPSENANFSFIQTGVLPSGESFVTNAASGVGSNPGGAIQIVTQPGAVHICGFSYFGCP